MNLVTIARDYQIIKTANAYQFIINSQGLSIYLTAKDYRFKIAKDYQFIKNRQGYISQTTEVGKKKCRK